MSNNTGGPAFPHENHLSHRGMTLRDYFAAKAMQGFLANANLKTEKGTQRLTEVCYEVADAMLKARER